MNHLVSNCYRFLHHHLLWFLVAAYALGGLVPQPGIWIRHAQLTDLGGVANITLLKGMLGLLLFNAGLGLKADQLQQAVAHRRAFLAALVAIWLVPTVCVLLLLLGTGWLAPETDFPLIIVGLAVVAAMPVAGSSTAWAQNADGNLALTLGLLLISTSVSPLTAWITFRMLGWLTADHTAGLLAETFLPATPLFMALWVVLPALGGIGVRMLVGGAAMARLGPLLKLVNTVNLLVLNYANAALCLPQILAQPQPGYLAITLLWTIVLAACSFLAAWPLGRVNRVGRAEQASLYFALGMRNNGAGLVLVSTALADPSQILPPIIIYNLVQHWGAGLVDRFLLGRRSSPRSNSPPL